MDPGAPRPTELLAAFFIAGIAFLLAGAVAAIADELASAPWLHWLSLHLVFLGGVSQLILGAGQLFTCAFLATSPPSRRFVGLALGIWTAGVILVAVCVPRGRTALVDVGGPLVAVGLVLFAAALRCNGARCRRRGGPRAWHGSSNVGGRASASGGWPPLLLSMQAGSARSAAYLCRGRRLKCS